MEKRKLLLFVLILSFTLAFASCGSGNRIGGTSKRCGCGMNKGMVGY
jgi:hypothetical protein